MKRTTTALLLTALLASSTALPAQAATPKVSSTVKAQLIYLMQEEKLARDVYAALAAKNITPKFANITRSEQMHMDELAIILKTYGIADPTAGKKPGVFTDKKLTALYKTLMAKGVKSATDAIEVGILIEETDIKDLDKLSKSITQADIKLMISKLRAGSVNHLAAFNR